MRRKRYIDKRLDWRDPDMPVIRKVIVQGKEEIKEIAPDILTAYYKDKLDNDRYWAEGNWKNDPSYDWRKKK